MYIFWAISFLDLTCYKPIGVGVGGWGQSWGWNVPFMKHIRFFTQIHIIKTNSEILINL